MVEMIQDEIQTVFIGSGIQECLSLGLTDLPTVDSSAAGHVVSPLEHLVFSDP